VQFVPQVVKAYRTKKVRDISLYSFVLVSITATTWIIHGLNQSDTVIISANVLVLISALLIIVSKILFR
jgi:MtN3 and saliva related transmembrane protein